MKKMVFAFVALFFLCQFALAGADYNVCFMQVDADVDGEVTRSEFAEAFPGGEPAVFDAADSDKGGTISHEEWEAYKQSIGIEEGEHSS